jgi:NAD-dependent SIR2 family protein deacetylase
MNSEINKIAELIKSSMHIAVFTGAGISTSCGIPDFRSENGLYNIVKKKYNLPYPEAIFEINYFKDNPKPFFELSKDFFSNNVQPSISHKFIAWLEEKNKISIIVTQNIDMLHEKAGSKKVIACHGTYSHAHCQKCGKSYKFKEIEVSMKNGTVPYCTCNGIIKPDVVFFGEQLPEEFFKAYTNTPKTDLLIVMGTSLQVQPAAGFALKLANEVKSIIINKDPTYYDDVFTYKINDDLDKISNILWNTLKSEI